MLSCDSFVILSRLSFFVNTFFRKLFVLSFSSVVFRDSFVILAHRFAFVNHFFTFFNPLFSPLRCSLESYAGLWLLVVSCGFLSLDDFAILTELPSFGKYFFAFFFFSKKRMAFSTTPSSFFSLFYTLFTLFYS